jgi:predicted CXXCH cytochrome family protein
MRRLAAAALAAWTLAAFAADEPHSRTYGAACLSCHATHKAAGQSLTNGIANESVCGSCHNLSGLAANFPLERFAKADPQNSAGSSHAWNAPPENAAAGAQAPLNPALTSHTTPNVICSTCHDEHHSVADGVATAVAGTQHRGTSTRIAGGGTGTVAYSATTDANSKGYLIDIVETGGAAGTARFRLSNDGGISWFGYSGGAWVPYAAGNARVTGPSVALNDGGRVTASFSGNFAIGDRIRFYVAYPFLRVALDSGDNVSGSKFCRDCHRSMVMDHTGANTWDGTPKSHPVGVTLNANGGGYDRALPLDANGLAQGGAGDGNATNDLLLGADQRIQCLTCHGVHHADGNSSSVDAP